MGAEPDCVRELPLVLDPVDVEAADADAVRRQAQSDTAPRQLVPGEEAVERPRERGDVAHLATDYDAGAERAARDLDEIRGTVVDDSSGRQLRRANLEADECALGRLALLAAAGQPHGRNLALAARHQIGELDLFLQVDHRLHLRSQHEAVVQGIL